MKTLNKFVIAFALGAGLVSSDVKPMTRHQIGAAVIALGATVAATGHVAGNVDPIAFDDAEQAGRVISAAALTRLAGLAISAIGSAITFGPEAVAAVYARFMPAAPVAEHVVEPVVAPVAAEPVVVAQQDNNNEAPAVRRNPRRAVRH